MFAQGLSRQTGIAVVAPASATAGKRSAAVNGALSSEAALSRLLAGTGLNFRFTSATSVTISG